MAVSENEPQAAPAGDRDSLYAGIAGLAPILAEIARYRALTDVELELASRVVARLSARASSRTEASLYDGLAGDVMALRLLDPGDESTALQRLVDQMTPAGWPSTVDEHGSDEPFTDIIAGAAGIVLAAVWAGGEHARTIATTGGEALLRAADRSDAGLDWGSRPGAPSRGLNYSHGTAGVATSLANSPAATGRPGPRSCSLRWRTPACRTWTGAR